MNDSIGYVVIGRNEGERLKACLRSISSNAMVYVDSGSSDGSAEWASANGADCVALDMSRPFTAARARNAGVEQLLKTHPGVSYVMFLDGDCVLAEDWVETSRIAIEADDQVAVVCGRRKERFPEHSLYNLLCDIEWNTPIGEAKACGGDALYRVDVFRTLGGFDPSFIAGEEPELCFRIRQAGYKILRVDQLMTFHDADIHSFSQWWRRVKRSGYAYWLNAYKHGGESAERFKVRETLNILMWGALITLTIILTLLWASPIPALFFTLFTCVKYVTLLKFYHYVESGYGRKARLVHVAMMFVGKVPQLLGVIQGMFNTYFSKPHTLVEYK